MLIRILTAPVALSLAKVKAGPVYSVAKSGLGAFSDQVQLSWVAY